MRRLPILKSVTRAANRELIAAVGIGGALGTMAARAAGAVAAVKEGASALRWPARPETINLELTAICDARCIHCPRHDMDRSQRPMDFDLFKRIIDEAAELKVPNIAPNGFGEVLTMRDLRDYFAYIRTKSHRFRILLNTNGHRMDEEKRRIFLDYEVDLVNVTLDGATAETFEAIREKLSFAQIEQNVHALLAERAQRRARLPKVRVGIVVIPQNAHEVQQVLDRWRGIADYVGAGGFTNRAGSLEDKFGGHGPHLKDVKSCVLPFRDLNIWAAGRAVLCCDDWNEEHQVGDLNTSSIADVWNGAALRHVRKMHANETGNQIDLCARCNYWRPPKAATRLWE